MIEAHTKNIMTNKLLFPVLNKTIAVKINLELKLS